jgi:exodeoxyribonuclease X
MSEDGWRTAPFAIVDVEGNGQTPQALVELGVITVDDGIAAPVRRWLIRPERAITTQVTRIHGITNDDVLNSPCLSELAGEIASQLHNRYFVAHHASVDWGIVSRELPDLHVLGVLDTLKLARALEPGRKSYQLGALVSELGLESLLSASVGPPHRVSYDVTAALRLFLHLVEQSSRGSLSLRELRALGTILGDSTHRQGSLF